MQTSNAVHKFAAVPVGLWSIRHDTFLYKTNTHGVFIGNSTRNSSGDEIANVNFLYDDIVHTLKMQ